MFWVAVGVVLLVWNVLSAINGGFFLTLPWANGFIIGAWAVVVFIDSFKVLKKYIASKRY